MRFRNGRHALAWYLEMTDIRFLSGQSVGTILVDNMGDPDDPRKEVRLNAMIDLTNMLERFTKNEQIFLLMYGERGFNDTFEVYADMVLPGRPAPEGSRITEATKQLEGLPCWRTCLCERKAMQKDKCFHDISRQGKHLRTGQIVTRFEGMLRKGEYLGAKD